MDQDNRFLYVCCLFATFPFLASDNVTADWSVFAGRVNISARDADWMEMGMKKGGRERERKS